MAITIALLLVSHSRLATAVTLPMTNSHQDIGLVRNYGQERVVQPNHHHQHVEVSTNEGRLL